MQRRFAEVFMHSYLSCAERMPVAVLRSIETWLFGLRASSMIYQMSKLRDLC